MITYSEMAVLVRDFGLPIALVILGAVALLMFFAFLGLALRWIGKNGLIRADKVIDRHILFLDDLTVTVKTLDTSVQGLEASAGELKTLLIDSKCGYLHQLNHRA